MIANKNMAKIEIEELLDHPLLISTVVGWIRQEWPKESGATEIEQRLCGDRARDRLPLPIVALEGSTPVGYVSLIQFETEECKGKRFWIDGLYVIPAYRGLGLGSKLLEFAVERARRLRLTYLCAYTDKISLYSRNGWIPLGAQDPSASGSIVMEKIIG